MKSEFTISDFFTTAQGLFSLATVLLLTLAYAGYLIVQHRRRGRQHRSDVERRHTPRYGRGGKLPAPSKEEPYIWQPEQDYDVEQAPIGLGVDDRTGATITRPRLRKRKRGRRGRRIG